LAEEGLLAFAVDGLKGEAMNGKQMIVGIVWLGFAALTVIMFIRDGSAVFSMPFDSMTNMVATIDLLIELALVSTWIYFDARRRGTSAIPFIVMTVFLGSLGPLTYLFFRFGDEQAAPIGQFARG
jgi:hypothetical protein